jgi:hypothetical protein
MNACSCRTTSACCVTTYPDAEIVLFGVEEPLSAIHSPNESVDPGELERIALAECLFLRCYSAAQTNNDS